MFCCVLFCFFSVFLSLKKEKTGSETSITILLSFSMILPHGSLKLCQYFEFIQTFDQNFICVKSSIKTRVKTKPMCWDSCFHFLGDIFFPQSFHKRFNYVESTVSLTYTFNRFAEFFSSIRLSLKLRINLDSSRCVSTCC